MGHVFDNTAWYISASHKKSVSQSFSVFMCDLGKFHHALYTSVDVFPVSRHKHQTKYDTFLYSLNTRTSLTLYLLTFQRH